MHVLAPSTAMEQRGSLVACELNGIEHKGKVSTSGISSASGEQPILIYMVYLPLRLTTHATRASRKNFA